MFKAIAGLTAVIVALLILFFLFRGDDEVSAEERYDGVHLCSPSQEAAATAEARTRSAAGVTRAPGDAGPLFAQNNNTWGREEYDHGARQDIGCGTTIEQCGCAMTSVATMLQLFQVLSTPDGTELTPSTMNAWFNQGAKLTANGWVSEGYSYGNVVWTAINGWTPTIVQSGEGSAGVSTELAPSTSDAPPEKPKGIRFKGWGSGSEEEIRRELQAGRPVVLEVPGHYIAAVGLEGDQIMINDPFYADRTTLASYAGRVKSARHYEPSDDMRSLMVTVPANLRVELKDATGRKVGTLGGDDPLAAEQSASTEIAGAVYKYEDAWRDPTCIESAPPPGSGTATIFIPFPEKGIYTVTVIDPDGGDVSAGVFLSDVNGKRRTETHEGEDGITFEIDYEVGVPTVVTDPATPTPEPSPTTVATRPPTAVPPTTGPGSPTPVPPTITPTITPTPSPTVIPVSIDTFTVSLDEINQDNPCFVTVSWDVSGPPDTEVFLYRQATGGIVATQPVQVHKDGVGEGSYTEPFAVGTRSYRLEASSRSDGSALKAPITVSPICIDYFTTADTCSQRVLWLVRGNSSGATWILYRRVAGAAQWGQIATGPVIYGQEQVRSEDLGSSVTYEYMLQVVVTGRRVSTQPISERWDNSDGCVG